MPPLTLTQLSSVFEGYGLKRDYVGWDEISANVKLAAIASEDQLFPEHNGFDWDALKKSLNQDPKRKSKKRQALVQAQLASKRQRTFSCGRGEG